MERIAPSSNRPRCSRTTSGGALTTIRLVTARPALPAEIAIREVGPRDGLQGEEPQSEALRVELVTSLAAAGLVDIEVAAFVSPKAVPAMAGAGDVLAETAALPIRHWALVPNRKGAELAVEAGAEALTATISASATYNQRNVGMTVDESLAAIGEIVAVAGERPVDAVVSCAFGSPYEGDLAPDEAAAIGDRLLDVGVAQLTYADTTGVATPARVEALLAETGPSVGLHLHDTRGTALVNAFAAMQLGITRFDTAVGGLGGSPFAHGAGGNLATEDLVHLCDDLGVRTGVDLDALLAVSERLTEVLGRAMPSRVAVHGPRSRLAAEAS